MCEAGFARRGAPAVVVEVAHNGRGIPPEVRKRLFDPVLHHQGKGTGLDHPSRRATPRRYGEKLRYQTELRRGTTFSIVLPRVLKDEAQNTSD